MRCFRKKLPHPAFELVDLGGEEAALVAGLVVVPSLYTDGVGLVPAAFVDGELLPRHYLAEGFMTREGDLRALGDALLREADVLRDLVALEEDVTVAEGGGIEVVLVDARLRALVNLEVGEAVETVDDGRDGLFEGAYGVVHAIIYMVLIDQRKLALERVRNGMLMPKRVLINGNHPRHGGHCGHEEQPYKKHERGQPAEGYAYQLLPPLGNNGSDKGERLHEEEADKEPEEHIGKFISLQIKAHYNQGRKGGHRPHPPKADYFLPKGVCIHIIGVCIHII